MVTDVSSSYEDKAGFDISGVQQAQLQWGFKASFRGLTSG